MFSEEQRRVAIETFIRYDHSYADTVAELGYPSRATLRLWWREYESTGEIPRGKGTRQSKYTDEQMRSAVDHYLEHGRSLSMTVKALGYPRGKQTLCDLIDETEFKTRPVFLTHEDRICAHFLTCLLALLS